jgi:hypothetical protein
VVLPKDHVLAGHDLVHRRIADPHARAVQALLERHVQEPHAFGERGREGRPVD